VNSETKRVGKKRTAWLRTEEKMEIKTGGRPEKNKKKEDFQNGRQEKGRKREGGGREEGNMQTRRPSLQERKDKANEKKTNVYFHKKREK